MRIEDNSYYIRFWVNAQKEESAILVHYKEVWDNGYSLDSYAFNKNHISFEDASWTGVSPDDHNVGTRILGRYFNRWAKKVDDCKLEIESMAKKNAVSYNKPLEVGDCLYLDMKSILDDEEDCDEVIDEYDGPDLYLVKITGTDRNDPRGVKIIVDEYDLYYKEVPSSFKEILDNLKEITLIPQHVYDEARSIISNTCRMILEEMNKECHRNKME